MKYKEELEIRKNIYKNLNMSLRILNNKVDLSMKIIKKYLNKNILEHKVITRNKSVVKII